MPKTDNAVRGGIFFCGGLNGVGKSTVLGSLAERRPAIQIVPGARALMAWLGLAPGDYQSLRRTPRAQADDALEAMIRHLATQSQTDNRLMIIDGHYLHILDGVVTSATRDWIGQMIGLLLITADPMTVKRRIADDFRLTQRDRRLFPPGATGLYRNELVAKYLAATAQEALALSRTYGLPMQSVDNNGPPASAAKLISSWIDTVLSGQ